MKKTFSKKFLGKQFSYKTEVDEHGRALWTEALDQEFTRWIYDLKQLDRELFKVQYSITENAYLLLNELKKRLGVYDDSLLVRAITIVFIDFIDTRKGRDICKKLDCYRMSENLDILLGGKELKKNLYFSPLAMRDVEAYSTLTGLKKSHVVKNALYSLLLLSIHEDEQLKSFWEKELLKQLRTMMKAA